MQGERMLWKDGLRETAQREEEIERREERRFFCKRLLKIILPELAGQYLAWYCLSLLYLSVHDGGSLHVVFVNHIKFVEQFAYFGFA